MSLVKGFVYDTVQYLGMCTNSKQMSSRVRHSPTMKHRFPCRLVYEHKEVINTILLSKRGECFSRLSP